MIRLRYQRDSGECVYLPLAQTLPDRTLFFLNRVAGGATVAEVADELGATSDQVWFRYGQSTVYRWVRAQRRAETPARPPKELKPPLQGPCRICGAPLAYTTHGTATCGPECAKAYVVLRRYLDPAEYDTHRRRVARIAVRNPGATPTQLAHARRVLDGTAPPPNRRWASRLTRECAERFGLADLLPQPKPKPPSIFCPTVNLDGTPCRRRVPAEGGICHIHAGAAARGRWPVAS